MNAEKRVVALVSCDASGEISRESREVLGAATLFAECKDWRVVPLVSANRESQALRELSAFGAGRILRLEPGPALASPATTAATLAAITQRPGAFFLPDTLFGQEVGARLAARLESDLVRGCTMLRATDGAVRLGRAYAGGRMTLELEWTGSGQLVVTVAQGAFSAPAASPVADFDVEDVASVVVEDERVRKTEDISPSPETLSLEEAEVLVAGGGGLGGSAGFTLLRDLAARLGGTVAASRVAVDRGWAAYDRQVGQTGKSVSPKLYLALGISGAPQHLAGIKGAGKVVAINRDPHAPIFEVADLAVVADLWEVLPCLLEELPAPTPNLLEVRTR